MSSTSLYLRIAGDVVRFDLSIERSQLLEVTSGLCEGGLELGVCLFQTFDLLQRVATDWIGEVFLGVLHQTIQGRGLVCKLQIQLLNLLEKTIENRKRFTE